MNLSAPLLLSGNFYDFNCVLNDRAEDGYQYIAPNLTFPCDGVVTKWTMGVEDKQNELVYLQIWRPSGTDYSRVAELMYNHAVDDEIAEIATVMTVSAGDVIGFFTPRGRGEGLRVAWAPVPDHTLLQGMTRSADRVSPVATFSGSPTTLSSSPLVSVIFGKLYHEGYYMYMCYIPNMHSHFPYILQPRKGIIIISIHYMQNQVLLPVAPVLQLHLPLMEMVGNII